MALIRSVNLKSSLSKTRGHSRPKVLNDLWFPKPDTHPKWHLHSCLKASNAIFVSQEPRLHNNQESRLYNNWKSCLTVIKNRVCITIESYVSTPLKFTSPLDQCDNHVCEGCVLSHTRSMSLPLQAVQQYTGKTNRQLHRFNSTPTSRPELMTSARLSF